MSERSPERVVALAEKLVKVLRAEADRIEAAARWIHNRVSGWEDKMETLENDFSDLERDYEWLKEEPNHKEGKTIPPSDHEQR